MTVALSTFADVLSIARIVQQDAEFVVRESYVLPSLVTQFNDLRGGNLRRNYNYNQLTAATVGEVDDLTTGTITPAVGQTLTPIEIGKMVAVSDLRIDSEAPEKIVSDLALELGYAAGDKIEAHLYADFNSLTGGSVGNVASAPTWSYLAAAIAIARNANKSSTVPLACVMHGYHWNVLAKSASVAGATVAVAPGYVDEITRTGYVGQFMGVDLYQIYPDVNGSSTTAWATGAVFPKKALALDVRRAIRVEAQRDSSLRATEFTMSAVYAHGIWNPALGVYFNLLAVTPTGV
jgi:hypothetical protein